MANYSYLNQSVNASCLIQVKDIDSFYNPTMNHTGFAWDGTFYYEGVQMLVSNISSPPLSPPLVTPIYASWYSEGQGAYRGSLTTFPQTGLVILSNAALTILDGSTPALSLWMLFLLQNTLMGSPPTSPPTLPGGFALVDNFNSELNGWAPSGLAYADGVLSVIYTPDFGNQSGVSGDGLSYNVNSVMVVHLDFSQDRVFLDVAVQPS